jgi:hypothetical protein
MLVAKDVIIFAMKINPLILVLVAVVIVAVVAGVAVLSKRSSSPQTPTTTQTTSQPTAQEKTETTTAGSSAPTVPLPQEEDIIRTFFNLIGEGRPTDAISMMTQSTIGNDTSKQTWGVQFNAFKSVSVDKIEPSMQEEWTTAKHTYKVTLNVQMKLEAQSAPIPNYGWDNGLNIRWIPLEKVDNLWKIAGIATGP